ncbi:hypothetical protein PYCCODRAFT_782658 [Trametes coccinea BRFM310]|uniref:Uncharacterized protein n=1 Tax=Trametes coccinea (strain BRFM310) TaxID=1353009 RepID=A0A1Y2J3B9_TRAC3|nr:hypothetical protein PYCCODRAFT_782658 [Trametes coccinea BRFM310]
MSRACILSLPCPATCVPRLLAIAAGSGAATCALGKRWHGRRSGAPACVTARTRTGTGRAHSRDGQTAGPRAATDISPHHSTCTHSSHSHIASHRPAQGPGGVSAYPSNYHVMTTIFPITISITRRAVRPNDLHISR